MIVQPLLGELKRLAPANAAHEQLSDLLLECHRVDYLRDFVFSHHW